MVLWNSLPSPASTPPPPTLSKLHQFSKNLVSCCYFWAHLDLAVSSTDASIHDNGGKFTGFAFQQMLCLLNNKPVLTMNKNLQANTICKQMHHSVATVLKTLLHANPPQSRCQAALLVDDALETAMHALQSTVSTTFQATPGGLESSHDMFLNVPLPADWQATLAHREQLVIDTLLCANKKHINLDYQIVKKSSSMTKRFKANSNLKLQGPLKFFGSTWMALWLYACGLLLLNVSMFAAPCHIGNTHLCNLIWNSCFSSSLIMGRESVTHSCASHRILGNPLM